MHMISIRKLSTFAGMVILLAFTNGCGSNSNPTGPSNQPGATNPIGWSNQIEVGNAPDTFQFQVSNLARTTQTLSYSWTNTGSVANVNQSGQVTSGEALLTIREGSTVQVYSRNLRDTGTFTTSSGATGSWRIEVRLTGVTGTLNFRVQKRS